VTRRLVLTADDVGIDRGTVDAVVELVAAGRLSAASVIPMAAWAAEAVAVLAEHALPGRHRGLSLGLHATFTADPRGHRWGPLSGATATPSLVSPGTEVFHPDVPAFAAVADEREVLGELRAQVDWFASARVRPTHLDSHHGALYGIDGPHFLRPAVRVCAERGLVLRLPRVVPDELGVLRPGVREMHRACVALADDLGVTLPETIGTEWRPLAQISGYPDLRDAYIALLRGLPEGVSEIFLHPAAEQSSAGPPANGMLKRVWERRLLQDDAFADALAREGIVVVPWP
jgi:predicted glycoside hydrolase/deacetylase ChbG (UPF0249 family)